MLQKSWSIHKTPCPGIRREVAPLSLGSPYMAWCVSERAATHREQSTGLTITLARSVDPGRAITLVQGGK